MTLPNKPLPRRVAIATFHNRLDRYPRRQDVPWKALVQRFEQHQERSSKDGPLWSPTDYRPDGIRGNRDVDAITCAVLDYDHGAVSWEEVRGQLDGLAYIAHSTFSHSPELPAFRVILPLAGPVFKDDWRDAWRRVHAVLGGDPAAKDPARIYYQPSHAPEGDFWTESSDGLALDIWELPFVAPLEGESGGSLDPVEILSGIPEGSRNDTLFRYASRLRGMGMSEDEARVLVLKAAENCKPALPEQEALGILARVYSTYISEVDKGLAALEYALDRFDLEPEEKDELQDRVRRLSEKRGQMPISSMGEWGDLVATMADPGWLCTRVWPADAYGVIAAADKSGKTWAISDLVLSKATATPWMDLFEVPNAGNVLVFFGEGGERKLWRRMEAVYAWKAQRALKEDGVILPPLRELPIRACFRVPQFTNDDHMDQVTRELVEHPAELVVIDPLYLAAGGADGSSLYDMGKHLYRVQAMVQAAAELHRRPMALVIVTHFKKGEDDGFRRISGVGPGAWGRVLVTAEVKDMPDTDMLPDKEQTSVRMLWSFKGDEIGDARKALQRKVWSDDPDALTAPMHYEVRPLELEAEDEDLSANERMVEAVLLGSEDELSTGAICGLLNQGRKKEVAQRTVQRALQGLVEKRRAERLGGNQKDGFTWRTTVVTDADLFYSEPCAGSGLR